MSLLVGLASSSPAREPVDVGPLPVGEQELTLVDSSRGRRVDVLLLYPESWRPSPLVIFSPGFLLSGPQYRAYGELLASFGIATALLTYQLNLLTPDHRVLTADLRFALAALLSGQAAVPLDGERVGLCGHSLGGKLSFLAAAEEDVRAVAGLDPVDAGPPGLAESERFPKAVPEIVSGLKVPALLLGAELGGEIRFGSPCAPPDLNYHTFYAAYQGPALEVTQLGAGHLDYLDNPDCGLPCAICVPGTRPAAEIHREAERYLLYFFRAFLQQDPQALASLDRTLRGDRNAGRVLVRSQRFPPQSWGQPWDW
ncbi:MAG: alpha/beta hydrolase family protein [Candidatus Bipolaricaulaceae bacterium]